MMSCRHVSRGGLQPTCSTLEGGAFISHVMGSVIPLSQQPPAYMAATHAAAGGWGRGQTDSGQQTDRQTDTGRQTQADRQAGRQTDRQRVTGRQTGRQTDRETQAHRQTYIVREKQKQGLVGIKFTLG